ncbi:hypothetical protein N7492_000982 [Penicillium capsulatum]|uniref:Major facilitator superfamily (MFS) profile domain-containing protein n=1 Tax=Penicillium capsulatum TaxID=69766 RepID=A0A9W9ITV1_9EURO|nr:hypothetical protein N7492_000982 [Penicillium capsulatum]KAJ6129959.1 hypothetical protein N7512_002739 [Penicillium capsulatum]
MISLQASCLIVSPYNFDPIANGLINIAPLIGVVLGFLFGGYLSDKSILWLSKRNNGIYEPEMRLWLAIPIAIPAPATILMFGLGLHGVHWALLAVGFGLFGFSLAAISGIALPYLMDCYQDIVGVIFMRNITSLVVLFALTPWVKGMGMQNLHIFVAVLAFVVYMAPVQLLLWGKACVATAARYKKMAATHVSRRMM